MRLTSSGRWSLRLHHKSLISYFHLDLSASVPPHFVSPACLSQLLRSQHLVDFTLFSLVLVTNSKSDPNTSTRDTPVVLPQRLNQAKPRDLQSYQLVQELVCGYSAGLYEYRAYLLMNCYGYKAIGKWS
ncbi:unnamed protein product [Vicia faba]|uniref:Uncharacterized protein n=1 Tax=Vicia faba TaxID=3906 RepID=A0AAV1AQZ8_VICFA|nr:unnamed protein product [Vicia faba]